VSRVPGVEVEEDSGSEEEVSAGSEEEGSEESAEESDHSATTDEEHDDPMSQQDTTLESTLNSSNPENDIPDDHSDDDADVDSDDDGDDNEGNNEQGTSGLANVMAKILGKRVPENKPAILAKAKTDREIQWRKRQLQLEKDESGEEKKTKTAENEAEFKSDFEQSRDKQVKRKQWEEMCHAKPNILERETERKLQRIATRGVVQLFNAVRKQQKTVEDKLKEAGSSVRRQDNVLKSVSKGTFLDMLKGKNSGDTNISTDIKVESGDGSSWRVLRDDFMMGAKMKDWDQESDQETEDV